MLYDGIVKRLNMERRYHVLLLLIVRCASSTCNFNLGVDFLQEVIRISLHFLERNLNFVIRRGNLPGKNLNINSREIYVSPFALVDISRESTPLSLRRHYLFKCNIGKAFRDEDDYALSQPLKP